MSGIKYEVLAGDDLISALRGGRTGDLLDDAAYAAADEIERLRGLLRNVLDAGEAEAKAEAEMRNAQRNYTNPRPYVDAWEQAMLAASNAEKEARAALAADQPTKRVIK